MERFNNKNGIFLVLSKTEIDGLVRNVIVPKGSNFLGWRIMEELLSEILRGGKKAGYSRSSLSQSIKNVKRDITESTRSHSSVVPQVS